jgi:RNA-binding protein
MPLNSKSRQALKAKAHLLKPVILIGSNGLTDAVQKEIDIALNHHELIKVRISTNDRDAKRAIYAEICAVQQAEAVQLIGNIGVVYRKNKD